MDNEANATTVFLMFSELSSLLNSHSTTISLPNQIHFFVLNEISLNGNISFPKIPKYKTNPSKKLPLSNLRTTDELNSVDYINIRLAVCYSFLTEIRVAMVMVLTRDEVPAWHNEG